MIIRLLEPIKNGAIVSNFAPRAVVYLLLLRLDALTPHKLEFFVHYVLKYSIECIIGVWKIFSEEKRFGIKLHT